MGNTLYFAYGSNLDLEHWVRWCEARGFDPSGLVPWRPAFLPDHELLFRRYSERWGGGVADVGPRIGAAVPGMMFHADAEAMRALDVKEGLGKAYNRIELTVLDDGGDLHHVTSYRLLESQWQAGLMPSDAYRTTIARGLSAHRLPLESLESAAHGSPDRAVPDRLFVYGTLLREQRSHSLLLNHRALRVGSATANGKLFHLGDYPGLVKGDGEVHGEVYRLPDSKVFSDLDDWEDFHGYDRADSPYRRVLAIVRGADGEEHWAWLYRYLGDLAGASIIASGAWRDAENA